MNQLQQLRNYTTVVADSSDFETIVSFKPSDATTNPSLIYSAVKSQKYNSLVDSAITYAKSKSDNQYFQLTIALEKLAVEFGIETLRLIDGRVSTEVDSRLSFDTPDTIIKARQMIDLYEASGIDRKRVLIKIAATWEGIQAAEQLTKEGINCNLTLLFSMPQAIACAEVGVKLISPFVGRILDWHLKEQGIRHITSSEEPGVKLVTDIFNYYKKYDYKTEIMAASFRNIDEIIELAGCDLMTISPKLLSELEQTDRTVTRKLLLPEKQRSANMEPLNEIQFRWMMNEDAMATEKLAEGIRKFTSDLMMLEKIILEKL
ncbi:MAG: transaldolase [Bacteroidales bacterium]